MRNTLIGFGAGAAAALLFASVSTGSWLAVLLFYLAPLPIMIAGIGWSHWAAMIAAVFAALALGLAFSPVFFFAFLAGAGAPAWWLSYLAMLARPVGDGPTATLEWYPPGRLVVWAAVLATLVVVAAIAHLGFDAAAFRAKLAETLSGLFKSATPTEALTLPGVNNRDRLIEFLVEVTPPAGAVVATITSLLNLWLAARIVKMSGRLHRPWPRLSDMRFPPLTAVALVAAITLSFAGGMLGILAGVLSASLFVAYGILGLAVLHAITLGLQARPFLIGGAYAAVLVFGWPLLVFCLLGLIDTMLDLRGRVARKRGPSATT